MRFKGVKKMKISNERLNGFLRELKQILNRIIIAVNTNREKVEVLEARILKLENRISQNELP